MKNYWISIAFVVVCAEAQTNGVIAYTRAPDGAGPWPIQDICTIRANGSDDRCLTSDGHSHHPAWSPGGRRILFIHDSTLSTRPPYKETDEYKSHHPIELSIMDADGRNRRVLCTIEPVIYSVAWSPDASTLAISAAAPTAGVFLLPATGEGELRLWKPNAWSPSWSPDGKRLAFTVEAPRGQWAIHTANRDGTNDVRLTDPNVNSGSPSWSPDGKQIAFEQITDAQGGHQVFVMNADGSATRQLTSDKAWSCTNPTWSPNGRELVVGCRSAGTLCGMGFYSTGQKMPECARRLFVVPVAGESPNSKELTHHDGAQPSFSFGPKP